MSAAAAVDYQWCQQANLFIGDTRECEAVVRHGYFQNGVDLVCIKASFSDEKLDCIKNAKNKEYTTEELQYCNGQTFDKDECMLNSGRAFVDASMSAERRLLRIENLASRALDALDRGNFIQAMAMVSEILLLATMPR